jgi:hypothetical protein
MEAGIIAVWIIALAASSQWKVIDLDCMASDAGFTERSLLNGDGSINYSGYSSLEPMIHQRWHEKASDPHRANYLVKIWEN